jgi:hypothetical protein
MLMTLREWLQGIIDGAVLPAIPGSSNLSQRGVKTVEEERLQLLKVVARMDSDTAIRMLEKAWKEEYDKR